MTQRHTPGPWYYPPLWLVVGSFLILIGTLQYCYGGSGAPTGIQTYPGLPALLGALDDMDHREGLALGITLLHLLD